jgi:hypothetical protein
MPDYDYLEGRLPRLDAPPTGIVIHSGATAPPVAEYLQKHRYSAHLSWSRDWGQIVQQVPLTHRAQHAGAANGWIGLELSGPWDQRARSLHEQMDFRRVMGILLYGRLELTGWCRHSDIDPDKRDPGPGFLDSWMDEMGLEHRPPPGMQFVR